MFLSLSDKTCLTNVMPVPIRTIVMNKTDPFNLKQKNINNKTKENKHNCVWNLSTNESHSRQKPMWQYAVLWLEWNGNLNHGKIKLLLLETLIKPSDSVFCKQDNCNKIFYITI